jgi:hypothetical protein
MVASPSSSNKLARVEFMFKQMRPACLGKGGPDERLHVPRLLWGRNVAMGQWRPDDDSIGGLEGKRGPIAAASAFKSGVELG